MTTCKRAIYGYIAQGFTLEGIMKSAMYHSYDECRHDLTLFRMLPDEWEALKKNKGQGTG